MAVLVTTLLAMFPGVLAAAVVMFAGFELADVLGRMLLAARGLAAPPDLALARTPAGRTPTNLAGPIHGTVRARAVRNPG